MEDPPSFVFETCNLLIYVQNVKKKQTSIKVDGYKYMYFRPRFCNPGLFDNTFVHVSKGNVCHSRNCIEPTIFDLCRIVLHCQRYVPHNVRIVVVKRNPHAFH